MVVLFLVGGPGGGGGGGVGGGSPLMINQKSRTLKFTGFQLPSIASTCEHTHAVFT